MTDTVRDIPGVGRQYLYRLPAEAGVATAWLSDATGGASVVWHVCPDGVARRAYRVADDRTPHGRLRGPGRLSQRLDVDLAPADRAAIEAAATAAGLATRAWCRQVLVDAARDAVGD